MNTALRGFGSYKRELLNEIFLLCGLRPFTYGVIKTLPSFERKSFFSLVIGDYIVVVKRNNPSVYRLRKPTVLHCKGTQSIEEWFVFTRQDAPAETEG